MRLAVPLAVLVALVVAVEVHAAHASSASSLRQSIRSEVRRVESAKTTLRFFTAHGWLLYSKSPLVKRRAWHDVGVARRRVIVGRARLRGLRAQLERASAPTDPRAAIRLVFGPYADQALRVSACETGGTFSVYARNGQYLGLFQMGDYARSHYGHSWTALGQARAAYRYFVDSGKDWSPWECKP